MCIRDRYRGRLTKKLSAVLILYPLVVAVNFLVPYVISIEYNRYPSPRWYLELCLHALLCLLAWLGIYQTFFGKIRRAGNYLTIQMLSLIHIFTATVPVYILKYIAVPTALNFAVVGVMYFLVHKYRENRILKRFAVSMCLIAICFILFSAHNIFTALYMLFGIPIMLTTVYGD